MERKIKKRAQLYGIAAVLLAIVLGIAVDAYAAHFIRQDPGPPPIASFNVSPNSPYYITWVKRSESVTYDYPTVTFTSASFDSRGHIVNHIWDFGDGDTSNGLDVVTHTYQGPGVYDVVLTVINDRGLSGTTYRTVTVVLVTTTLSIYPSEISSLEVGETFKVNIFLSNVEDFGAWQAGIQVDPNILECVSFEKTDTLPEKNPLYNESTAAYAINEGLFSGTLGKTIWITPEIDNVAGEIGPAGCCLAPFENGVSGEGSLATITFKVKNSGSCTLELMHVLLLSSEGSEIPFNLIYGSFGSG